jgi:Zn-dependent oligopeptidase
MDKQGLLTEVTKERKDVYSGDEITQIVDTLLAIAAVDAKEVLTAIASREDEPSRQLMQELGMCDDLYQKVVTVYRSENPDIDTTPSN